MQSLLSEGFLVTQGVKLLSCQLLVKASYQTYVVVKFFFILLFNSCIAKITLFNLEHLAKCLCEFFTRFCIFPIPQ